MLTKDLKKALNKENIIVEADLFLQPTAKAETDFNSADENHKRMAYKFQNTVAADGEPIISSRKILDGYISHAEV